MDTATFKVSDSIGNPFIYCCLIFNTIKQTYSIKSLIVFVRSTEDKKTRGCIKSDFDF